jgi:PUA domain protein
VRKKHISGLLKLLEIPLGREVDLGSAFLETADFGPFQLLLVDRQSLVLRLTDEAGVEVAFPTLRGLLEWPQTARWAEVDHGAIPFLMNGADCMAAGITAVDSQIKSGDLVWVRDEEHAKPLAIGSALLDGAQMLSSSKGKAVSTMHWIGDELWNLKL